MDFLFRFRNVLVLVLLLVVQIVGLGIQIRRPVQSGAPDGRPVAVARSWVAGAVSPFERATFAVGHGVVSVWSNYLDLRGVRQQNSGLRRQIGDLKLRQAALAEDALQGQRLQALLAFQQHYIASTVAAEVIGSSGSESSRVLYLNKGSADGLRADMPVITPEGIVGKIREVFPATAPHTAAVLLISDQTSGAGVILANTRIRAILHGAAGGRVLINNLTPDDRIRPGEPVLTSGGDQVFPRGLPVGTIESVAPDPAHQPYTTIRVKPAANLLQIDEVLVITGTEPHLPPEAQHELAADAATSAAARAAAEKAAAESAAAEAAADQAAAARSAAEIVADRLPGLEETGQGKAGTGAADGRAAIATAGKSAPGADKTPGGAVPRPPPTVHTDRYSPGASPPASTLTPGGSHAPHQP